MEFFLAGITPKNTAEAEAEPAVALPPTTKHTDGDFHSCSHCFRGSISPEQAVQGAGSVIQQVSYLMTSAFHATVPEVCAQAIVEVSMAPVTCDYKWYWLNVEKVEWIIYVTDVGRWQTFDKFFKVARMAGWLPDPKEKKFPKTSHAELGLVLGADGKREGVLLRDLLDKAKTRSKKELIERFTENGKIVDWTDEELEKASEALGYGAVKYADLKNDGVTNYTRSLDGMLSDMGNTAVYLQYALAHVCSIIRKSNMDVEELKASGNISLAHQDERDLGLHLIRYAEAVEDGCTKLLPSVVCEYLYKLSRIFTTFCANCPMVVGSPEEASRLMLCEATAIVTRQCFELLGITPVHKL